MHRTLTKGRDRLVAGVCSGIAEYFGIDVTIVRIICAALIILYPQFFIAMYIIAAILMPDPYKSLGKLEYIPIRSRRVSKTGLFLVLLGLLLIVSYYYPALLSGRLIAGILLLVLGLLLMAHL